LKQASGDTGHRPARFALLLFAFSLVVYNLNFQRIASGDTLPASLLPFSILLERTINLDFFYPAVREHAPQHLRALPIVSGHAYSEYPIALPILLTPLYVPAAVYVTAAGWGPAQVMVLAGVLEKLTASLIAASSVAFFYLLAVRLGDEKRARWLTILYGFGTATWTISGQALWQHGGSQVAIILALLYLDRLRERADDLQAVLLAGLFAALSAAIRPTNILFVAAAFAGLLASSRRVRLMAAFWLFPVLTGGATAAYNLAVFGAAQGALALPFDTNLWRGLAGVLFSPARGLFVYSPVLLFSVAGVFFLMRQRQWPASPVYLAALVFAASQVVLIAKWRIWWGGHCYGPRLLADAAPAFVILMAPAMDTIFRSRTLRAVFVILLTFSVFVQAVGAFCYPASRWDEEPASIGERPGRLWDWTDNPILRSVKAGPRFGPVVDVLNRLRTR
jgi:hypothetical protein